ncbi:MAG TPA: Gx transporter family protein, partial [Clostridia bacterium]|nr:Gx transporter family protein [Clostridia bacterium]
MESETTVAKTNNTRQLVLSALIFAAALVLAAFENALPPIPVPVPGVKLGLSNIAVMYALFFLSGKRAFAIAVLKAIFVFSTRGLIAGIISLSGGIVSVLVMLVMMFIFSDKISYLLVSISGAVFHNIGQITAAMVIYSSVYLASYIPFLVVAGVIAGIATAVIL